MKDTLWIYFIVKDFYYNWFSINNRETPWISLPLLFILWDPTNSLLNL